MPKKTLTTTIACSHAPDNCRHKVTFHADGTVTSSGCGELTDEARKIATLVLLGRPPLGTSSCVALAALVLHGCESILNRRPNSNGDQPLDGWVDVYIRFESLNIVKQTMARTRNRLRRKRRRLSLPLDTESATA